MSVLFNLLVLRNVALVSCSRSILAKSLSVLPSLARPFKVAPFIDLVCTNERLFEMARNDTLNSKLN